MQEQMTKQDAIEYLLYLKHDVQAKSPMDIALDTAIESLKQPTIEPEEPTIEPEVRLIDANALHAKIYEDSERNYGASANIAQVLLRIETAPTIEAEPVRHANAIYMPNSKGYPSCSYCHEEMPFFLNFCPCCGAEIDTEVDKC